MAMATRSIVTSQPDVVCEICGRRLLRGELPEVFLAGGERRTVCELCVPRASHEGWLRESDDHPVSRRALRGRRGRTLIDRLRALRESGSAEGPGRAAASAEALKGEGERYDFLAGPPLSSPPRTPAFFEESFENHDYEPLTDGTQEPAGEDPSAPSNHDLKAARAIEVFNASEQPRRVCGVARSLGVPLITVRQLEDSSSRVSIVVAWELCWYRYEVDLADEAGGVVLGEQGMELEELPKLDRTANAVADERGELELL
jgi:hypothetical protein